MGMQVGAEGADDDVVSAINTTPLVDVMLVLLIIFLITIPVATQAITVALPSETAVPRESKPDTVSLGVDRDGNLYWNTTKVADEDALVERLKTVSVKVPQPEIQIRGDQDTPYHYVARLVKASQRAGIQKVGFITEPPPRS
ncbi:ExbD/TolR family protein [Xylophilus sp.]|uniref:ExbD/TolR family protein n=1 Tax=Xylophilus sp. TaxID=2653893 RepID=UPI0013BBCB7A|nr:biopolymer transporter ExbD [Xylophilus sp.]KAF1047665.1 MAG: Biopolymer transport protein ExbD [Xylophilus sp.]